MPLQTKTFKKAVMASADLQVESLFWVIILQANMSLDTLSFYDVIQAFCRKVIFQTHLLHANTFFPLQDSRLAIICYSSLSLSLCSTLCARPSVSKFMLGVFHLSAEQKIVPYPEICFERQRKLCFPLVSEVDP